MSLDLTIEKQLNKRSYMTSYPSFIRHYFAFRIVRIV
jgi:hypothetical protein